MTDTHLPLHGDWWLWRDGAVRGAGMPFGWLDWFATAGDEAAARQDAAAGGRLLVEQDAFVAAVTWQNPSLVDNWLGEYADAVRRAAAAGEPAVSVPLPRRDQREAVLAMLCQRYCAKNETIGFFGPVAWARFDGDGVELASTGTAGIRTRTVFVEWWAVAAIAKAVAADPEMAASVPVRRHPVCGVADGIVYQPRREPGPTTPTRYRILATLDRPCCLARLRERVPAEDFDPALTSLLADGLVRHELAVPLCERPERWLRDRLAAMPVTPARDRWLARLAAFHHAVAASAGADDRPPALRTALAAVDGAFGELAGQPAPVRAGRRYGRTPVYEDCRRDLDVRVGGPLLDALRAPLALLLQTARWLVAEVAAEVTSALVTRHAELRRGGRPVSLAQLTLAAADVLSGAPGTAVHRVVDDFTSRWAELLELAEPDGVLHTAAVARLAAALFPAPHALPWRAARQHSPDLLLRLRPGRRPQWVLGELHLALNTLENRPFVTQADDRARLLAATCADFAGGRIVPVWPSSSAEVTSRTYPPLGMDLPDQYDYWSYTLDEGRPDGCPAWPGSMLTVVEAGPELAVQPPDGRWRRALAEFLAEFLTALVVNRFHIRPRVAHRPRLLVDDVVVEREAWRLPAADLPVGSPDAADYRHRELAAALSRLGCPRYTFATLPGEPKPFLVDRSSPLLLRGLARAVRRELQRDPVAVLDLVEMLPSPAELWLRDGQGQAYTSEFRLVLTDRRWAADTVAIGAADGAARA